MGSALREILDHIIPLNEQHLRRLGRDYLAYYHEDRTHIGLEKETPARRPIESRPAPSREPLCLPRIAGLQRRTGRDAFELRKLAHIYLVESGLIGAGPRVK